MHLKNKNPGKLCTEKQQLEILILELHVETAVFSLKKGTHRENLSFKNQAIWTRMFLKGHEEMCVKEIF